MATFIFSISRSIMTKRYISFLSAFVIGSASLSAISITPSFDSFGTLAAATFAGTGIPNDSVAISTFGTTTLGLTAHQRYDNPALSNDGAGTFAAGVGNDAAHGQPTYAIWNFGFYYSGIDSGNQVKLYYD
ncbi:MAG: hypothetical protein H8M99_04285, partial [Gloeobacteraceae cyanobacterium ES-bin-144]|nr:hypothetical protein [Verrucomicrobiales bacterium]